MNIFVYSPSAYIDGYPAPFIYFFIFFWWQLVAIKQLDHNGAQGIREFIVEVMTLGSVDHPNLVKLIGFCAEGVQRLLVYEYMPLGSLEDCLHGILCSITLVFILFLHLPSILALFIAFL